MAQAEAEAEAEREAGERGRGEADPEAGAAGETGFVGGGARLGDGAQGSGDGLAGGVAAGRVVKAIAEDEAREVAVTIGGEPEDRAAVGEALQRGAGARVGDVEAAGDPQRAERGAGLGAQLGRDRGAGGQLEHAGLGGVAGRRDLQDVQAGPQAGQGGQRATVDAHAGVLGADEAANGSQRALLVEGLQEGEADVGAVEGAVGAALGVEGEGEGVAVAGALRVAASAVGEAELELDVPEGGAAQGLVVEGGDGGGLDALELGDHVVVALLEVSAAGRGEAGLDGGEGLRGGLVLRVGLGEQALAQRSELAEGVTLAAGGVLGPVHGGGRGAGPQQQLAGAGRGGREHAQEGAHEAEDASGAVPYHGRVSGTRRLGRYEVGERIGSGGLADVYVAHVEGAQGFRKRLVIKQLHRELHAHPEAFALLLAEAQLVQRLSHGNIVQVFDFGVDAQVPYLVMEHVDGVALTDLAGEGQGDASAVFFVIESVCAALDYAHGAVDDEDRPLGLVHRDVTPANILVSREGLVKLTDFGIARLSAAAGAEGRAIGTPGYRAPEQAAGALVDRRADVYALGVILGELARDLEDAPLRAALIELAARAAAPEPARRLADASALARALEALRSEHGVPRGPGELAARVRRVQRERRRVAHNVDAALGERGPARTEVLTAPRAGRRERRGLGLGLGALAIGGLIVVVLPDREVVPAEAVIVEPTSVEPGRHEAAIVEAARVGPVSVAPREPPVEPESSPGPVSPAPPSLRTSRVRVPQTPGRLRVNLIPWAEASLDGAPLGRTPIDRTIAPGRHTLELHNPGSGLRRSREIEVGRGGELDITEW